MSLKTSSFPGFVIENTTIAVDFWPTKKYNHITHAFLTHAHTDHTQNLDATYTQQIIHCTELTKNLLVDLKGMRESQFNTLDMNRTHVLKLDETESFNVTLIDSNHCPGSVMFLFEGYFGKILATGDFRYTPSMFIDSPLTGKEIEICYFDNTYLHEKFNKTIPSRETAIKDLLNLITKRQLEASKLQVPDDLIFLLKFKLLGKEKILIDLYNFFKVPIVVALPRYKRYTEVLLMKPEMFSVKPAPDSFIFIEDSDLFASGEITEFFEFKSLIKIEPTCLPCHDKSAKTIKIPYTDHSSNSEIHEFIRKLRPKKIVPIVRQALPGNIDTTDIEPLRKYLSKKQMIKGVTDKYRLLLKSSTSVKHGANLNLFQLAKKTSQQHFDTPFHIPRRVKKSDLVNNKNKQELELSTSTPINNGRILVPTMTPVLNYVTIRRSARLKKCEIEYETPEKRFVKGELNDLEDIFGLKKKQKKEINKSPYKNTPSPKKYKELKGFSVCKQRQTKAKITMATITEEQNSEDKLDETEECAEEAVNDPFETSHISESNASVKLGVEESETSTNISRSFCFYAEDLLKQSKWKRLSDQVEMLQNLSNDLSVSDSSPVKTSVGEKNNDVNKLLIELNNVQGSSQESTILADSTNKLFRSKTQESVEEMTSEKSLIIKTTEKDTMNLENESDSDESLIYLSDREDVEQKEDAYFSQWIKNKFQVDDKFIAEIDLKNLLFDIW